MRSKDKIVRVRIVRHALHQSAEGTICTVRTFSAQNGQVIFLTPNCIWGIYSAPLQGWELLPTAARDPKNRKA